MGRRKKSMNYDDRIFRLAIINEQNTFDILDEKGNEIKQFKNMKIININDVENTQEYVIEKVKEIINLENAPTYNSFISCNDFEIKTNNDFISDNETISINY